jgi:(S)-ureidoglycine aminohydrolase
MAATRSVVRRDHALLAPESHVSVALPGWTGTAGIVLIGPAMGARFSQMLALMAAGGEAAPPLAGVERFLYVLDGELRVGVEALGPGGYAFVPPEEPHAVTARRDSRVLVVEKAHVALAGAPSPHAVTGREADVRPEPLLGDEGIQVRALLPDAPQFDMAVNTMTYAPGAALSQVEVHVMEHGLLMLGGRMVYRLADSWYQVGEGDAIWMGPFCPQWCCAYGPVAARYLIYKDWNRDPLA